jgi:hypothetical protein
MEIFILTFAPTTIRLGILLVLAERMVIPA